MYGYKKEISLGFDDALIKISEELKKEGFGVLTKIDVKATLKRKLNIDFDRYIILGACNPSFAHATLNTERDIGLLLPCNVIVYEDNGKVVISAILPTVVMSVVENEELKGISEEVEERLKKVIDSVNGS